MQTLWKGGDRIKETPIEKKTKKIQKIGRLSAFHKTVCEEMRCSAKDQKRPNLTSKMLQKQGEKSKRKT